MISRSRLSSRPGRPATVTSNVNIYVINAATGAVVVGAAQNNNNVATQEPLASRHDPRCRQLLRRDPGRIRGQPGPRRVRRMSTKTWT